MPNYRKPKDLKILHGTFRADRNPANEPDPEKIIVVPKPPSHLNKWAKKMWKRLAEKIIDAKILTALDLEEFEICCAAYGEYRAAYEAVYRRIEDPETGRRRRQTFQEYMEGRNSQTMPEYISMKSAWSAFKSYAAEFGLSPVARNRIDIPMDPDEEDPIERMWNEG